MLAGVKLRELLGAVMGEIEGSYRVLQTPGTRLGAQFNAAISTLEPGQSLNGNSGNRNYGRLIQIRVQGLDDSQEFFDIDVSFSVVIYLGDTVSLEFATQQADLPCLPLVCVWHGFVTAATWLWC